MGLDVESEKEPLTATRAATLTNLGILTTKISRGKPPNDAQLDELISHYETQQLLGLTSVPSSQRPQGFGDYSPKKISSRNKGSLGNASSLNDKKRRSWDDDDASDATKIRNYKNIDISDDDDYMDNSKIKSKNDTKNKGPNFSEDPWGTREEMTLRKSLSETLQELSDREGLTDDELQNKVRSHFLL